MLSLLAVSFLIKVLSKIQTSSPFPSSAVLGLVPDRTLQPITEKGITPECIRIEIFEVTTEAIGDPIIFVGATEASIHGASITVEDMETTAPTGRTTGKHTVLVGAVPDPGPQREGPRHRGPGAILGTLISLLLTGQGALRPLVLLPTTAVLSPLNASPQRRKSPPPRTAGHLRLLGITREMRPRSSRFLEAPLKMQKRLRAQSRGQMPPPIALVPHHGPQFLT